MKKETRELLEKYVKANYYNHPAASHSFSNKEEAMQDLYKQLTSKIGYRYFERHRETARRVKDIYHDKMELKKYIPNIFQLEREELRKIKLAIVCILGEMETLSVNVEMQKRQIKELKEIKESLGESLKTL